VINFIKRNLEEINKNGFLALKKKTEILIKFLFFIFPKYLICMLFLFFIYLLKPIFHIRFYQLNSSRIGHFALNPEIYLCEKEFFKKKSLDIFCYQEEICNSFLAEFFKRKLIILPRHLIEPIVRINNFLSKYFSYFKNHKINITCPDRDVNNLFDKFEPHFKFTDEENNLGMDYLKSKGLNKNSKFIILYVRDSKYLKVKYPNQSWGYHDYRNYDIEDFIPAAEDLTRKGFFVFRMGSVVEKKIETNNKMIIDYASSNERSDFLDIFLCAKCNFCLSTSSGFDGVPQIFRRPVASIFVPFYLIYSWSSNQLVMTKHHFSISKKRNLKFSELLKIDHKKLLFSNEYEKNDIKLISNSPSEILEFANEAVSIFTLNDKNIVNQKNQKIFWGLFEKLIKNQNLNNYHGKYKAIISMSFLKKNAEWLQ
tara:strand:+ start:913 stop:2187 length:1275 start_codon:yes stop_codon:yes gene_type:complete